MLTTILLLFLVSCSTQPAADIPSPLDLKSEFEPKLRSVLPKGWSLTAKENTFTLMRDEKVYLYVEVAWDVGAYRDFDEAVKHYGTLENYQVVLRFEPRLSDAEYEQLKLTREEFEKLLNGGAHSKDEWSLAIDQFYRHEVPVYFTDKYSVFAQRSDNYPARVYPESVLPECQQVLASVDKLFQRYERSEGRHSDF